MADEHHCEYRTAVERLEVENEILQHHIDDASKRLKNWEQSRIVLHDKWNEIAAEVGACRLLVEDLRLMVPEIPEPWGSRIKAELDEFHPAEDD